MMLTEVILLGYCMTCVHAAGVVDIVLSCSLVDDAAGMGTAFARTQATLVLKDIQVTGDESLDTLTPFIPPLNILPGFLLFEAAVSSVDIPNVDVLLHAECNDQEVMCEISRYTPQGSQQGSGPTYFMVSLNVEEAQFSTSLILQTLEVEKSHTTLIQQTLGLPLSRSGTLLTKVVFLVFSHITSISGRLRGDVLLNCGFKQQEMSQKLAIDWRQQHQGKGNKVFAMRMSMDDAEGSTVVFSDRRGSSMDSALVVGKGNASVTLTKLTVSDEGMYICAIRLGPFHVQQVVQLSVNQPPQVSLSEEKLVLKNKSPQTLSCHSNKYYPLDAQMEWLYLSPTDSEPVPFPSQGSLSSHRQHGDGTFSLSSHFSVPPTVSPGTNVICRVSHAALDAPLSVSVVVESPEPDSYLWILGFLVITGLFFYQVMR